MDKSEIRETIIGDPSNKIAGMQDDWWTGIAPDIWESHGSYLRDISGTKYLDMGGFFSTAPIRFDHPRLRDKSFVESIGKAAIYRPSIADFWTIEMAEFVNTFREIATPPYMHHLFFIDGGSLAVENALKAAFDWKVRLNLKKGKLKSDPQEALQPLGTKVLHFERAFHGRSGYTLSVTHTHDPNKYKYFPKFDWFRLNPPVLRFDVSGQISNEEEVKKQSEDAVSSIQKILTESADDIAAILIEPIQCEGGDRHIPVEFFIQLRRLADEHDIILIYDEVQTGFGTTGKMWGHEHFDDTARPDIISFAKKSQVGGIIANYEKFSMTEVNVFGNSDACKSRINSTWGGNPVDMIRCTQFMKIIQEDNLIENARKVGDYMLESVQELCREFDTLIENPRGKGVLLGFDAKNPQKQSEIWSAFRDEQLLCLTCGSQTLRFRPHLDLTIEEVDDGMIKMKQALRKLTG